MFRFTAVFLLPTGVHAAKRPRHRRGGGRITKKCKSSTSGNNAEIAGGDAPDLGSPAPSTSLRAFERHEFLGDRVIGYLVAHHVFDEHPTLQPLLALNVDNEKLARAAVAHGLHRFLRHDLPLPCLPAQVREFTADIASYPVHSNGLVKTPKILAGIIESIMGAVDVDSGHDQERLWKVFRRLADPLIAPRMVGKHQMCEFRSMYRAGLFPKVKITGHWKRSKTIKVVDVHGETLGSATYAKSRIVARNRAVKSALAGHAQVQESVARRRRCRRK
uniref:RNase III domain-containing protein n=1 Tax=Leersia perrieri TaxID=77586 RepID=A0A0D9V243_9ORYZ